MSKRNFIDIYNLSNEEEFEKAISLIEKTINALDDLEDYYYELDFNEDMKETRETKEWWIKKLCIIKSEYIEYRRNKKGE